MGSFALSMLQVKNVAHSDTALLGSFHSLIEFFMWNLSDLEQSSLAKQTTFFPYPTVRKTDKTLFSSTFLLKTQKPSL